MTDLFTRAPIIKNDDWPFSDDEDDMPRSPFHIDLAEYLKAILTKMYRAESWFVSRELAVYGPNQRNHQLSPDVAVFIGTRVPKPYTFSSWYIGEKGNLPPRVVFEIASPRTWKEDFDKLPHYATWGIEEVYIYDPGIPRVWPRNYTERLHGYRVQDGLMVEQPQDSQGRVWSVALESGLIPAETLLMLADTDGKLRLSEGEATEERANAAQEQAETEARQEAEARLEKYRALLRANGIDPDSV